MIVSKLALIRFLIFEFFKGPLYRVYILANGLEHISRCKEPSYRHGGAMGTIVQAGIGVAIIRGIGLLHC